MDLEEQPVRSFSFTMMAWQKIWAATDRKDFWAMDAEAVFNAVT